MKDEKKVLIIIGIVIAIVIAVSLYCIKRIPTETITLEEFQKNTQNCGYEYVDNCVTIPVEELGKSGTAYIKDQIGVEFTECISDSIALSLYSNYAYCYMDFKQSGYSENFLSLKHYGTYTMETQGMYMHITRIKNTVMNVQVPIEEKPIVVKFMKDLKYLN